MSTPLVVRRAADRFVTRSPGVETRHAFSFGRHYDPAHVAHGPLVVHDEHLLEPHAGFAPHSHRDLEILSWVLDGALVHDEAGRRRAVVRAGTLQRMTTGGGIVHAERAGRQPTRFLQLWLTAEPGTVAAYEQVVVRSLDEVLPGLHAGRLDGSWPVPDVPRAHLHVASGACTLGGVPLEAGDAVRLTAAGRQPVRGAAELLLVELPEG